MSKYEYTSKYLCSGMSNGRGSVGFDTYPEAIAANIPQYEVDGWEFVCVDNDANGLFRRPVSQQYLDTTTDSTVLQRRMGLLATALGDVLVKVGLLRADHEGLTGPELLMAAADYCDIRDEFEGLQLVVGDEVARDDGRFYVPVSRVQEEDGVSNIVLRVASDAFEDAHDATAFAHTVADRWNLGARA